jgi:hypothetical protein
LTTFLKKFDSEDLQKKLIPRELKDDLWVWKKGINAARLVLPLAENFEAPPPLSTHVCFGRSRGSFRMEGWGVQKHFNSW